MQQDTWQLMETLAVGLQHVTLRAQGILANHLTTRPSSSAFGISLGLKSHNTALVLISAICTVINPRAPVHTFLPNKQVEVDTTYSNSSPQAHTTPGPKSNFALGFSGGHVCQTRQLASISQVISPVLT